VTTYSSDQDWTDEAEAEQAASAPRAGAPALGVPIVTAVLGLLVGVLGTSLWWSWSGATRAPADPVAVTSPPARAPAGKTSATAPATPPVAVSPAPAPVVESTAPRDSDDAALLPSPPAAGPASTAATTSLSAEEVARRRERAWARFYKRPATCEGNPTGDQLVECGNHYIRMRREFDERWRAGNL
jgi:hypothetical protein